MSVASTCATLQSRSAELRITTAQPFKSDGTRDAKPNVQSERHHFCSRESKLNEWGGTSAVCRCCSSSSSPPPSPLSSAAILAQDLCTWGLRASVPNWKLLARSRAKGACPSDILSQSLVRHSLLPAPQVSCLPQPWMPDAKDGKAKTGAKSRMSSARPAGRATRRTRADDAPPPGDGD